MKYTTEDYETGIVIDQFDTYAAALDAVARYEAADRANGAKGGRPRKRAAQ